MRAAAALGVSLLWGCAPGPSWLAEAAERDEAALKTNARPLQAPALPVAAAATLPRPLEARRIGGEPDPLLAQKRAVARNDPAIGRRIGVFRNTYYDFPEERAYSGDPVNVFDASCQPLASVPLEFHDTLCMQGSGLLSDGRTLSFARRDCACARRCPRSKQQICFEALAPEQFPWGRGTTGEPITPLLSVAVDVDVIPLGTPLFIPEYLGLPRDPERRSEHDGCFIAQDRGVMIQGQHIDVFTGEETLTRIWNRLVPSNRGVTVIVDSPFCSRFSGDTQALLAAPPEPAPTPTPRGARRKAPAPTPSVLDIRPSP
jgi:3D (Asp-Asp-Asp) domain-containing protein